MDNEILKNIFLFLLLIIVFINALLFWDNRKVNKNKMKFKLKTKNNEGIKNV